LDLEVTASSADIYASAWRRWSSIILSDDHEPTRLFDLDDFDDDELCPCLEAKITNDGSVQIDDVSVVTGGIEPCKGNQVSLTVCLLGLYLRQGRRN